MAPVEHPRAHHGHEGKLGRNGLVRAGEQDGLDPTAVKPRDGLEQVAEVIEPPQPFPHGKDIIEADAYQFSPAANHSTYSRTPSRHGLRAFQPHTAARRTSATYEGGSTSRVWPVKFAGIPPCIASTISCTTSATATLMPVPPFTTGHSVEACRRASASRSAAAA